MSWKVDFYSSRLLKDILGWPEHLLAKFSRTVDLIKKNGPEEVGMPNIKPLGKGLFEIRVKNDE